MNIEECTPEDTENNSSNQPKIEQNQKIGLTLKQKLCFSVGHIQNDLQAYAATSYLLLFLSKVIGLQKDSTGIIFLVAQVADGILSPVLGLLCDRNHFPFLARFGKRKGWHIFGITILLIFSPFLFVKCLPCELTSEYRRERVAIVWYSLVVIAIHMGFATVQISHLALLPDVAKKDGDHVKLNSLRTTWMFISGIFVYGVFWLLLGRSEGSERLSGKDKQEFLILGIIIVIVGFVFTCVFYAGINENDIKNKQASITESANNLGYEEDGPSHIDREDYCNQLSSVLDYEETAEVSSAEASHTEPRIPTSVQPTKESIPNSTVPAIHTQISNNQLQPQQCMKTKVKRWFRIKQFYMVGIVYMCSRIVVNISNAYFPFYLEEVLKFEKEAIAYFPLVVLIASALFSWVAKKVSSHWNNHVAYCLAAVMSIVAYIWLYNQQIERRNFVYGAAVFMGAGSSMMLITALTLAAVMIDTFDKTTGAFVFGIMSLTDKVANGVIVSIVQMHYPEPDKTGVCLQCERYIQKVFPLITGCAALLSLLIVMVMYIIQRKDNNHNTENRKQVVSISSCFDNTSIDAIDTKL